MTPTVLRRINGSELYLTAPDCSAIRSPQQYRETACGGTRRIQLSASTPISLYPLSMISQDYRDKLYSEYAQERAKLDDASLEAGGRYDRAVLTISTGALALSIVFVEKIASKPATYTVFLLVIAWTLLLVSIVFELLALDASQRATTEQISILDEKYMTLLYGDDGLLQEILHETPQENPFSKKVSRYNTLSFLALVVGIVLIMIFSALNMLLR